MRRFVLVLIVTAAGAARADVSFREAEQAKFDSGWQVKEHFTGWYLGVPSGLRHLAGTGKAAVARLAMKASRPGKHKLWLRYLELKKYRGPFEVAVMQDGKVLAEKVFDRGLIRSKRLDRYFAVFVWDSLDFDCREGEVLVEIRKPAPRRGCCWLNYYVDCLVLSDDPNYVPKVEDFGPQFFVKVRNEADPPLYFMLDARRFRRPSWFPGLGYLGKDGVSRRRPKDSSYLGKGDESGWINIRTLLDPVAASNVQLTAYTDDEETAARELNMRLLLGRAERKDGEVHVVKEFAVRRKGARFIVQVNGFDAAGARSARQIVEEKLTKLRAMGLGGLTPARRFLIATGLKLECGLDPPDLIEKECRILRALGFNSAWSDCQRGIHDRLGPEQKVVVHKFFFHLRKKWPGGSMNEPRPDKIDQTYSDLAEKVREEGDISWVWAVNVMDEPGTMSLEEMAGRDVDNAKFREYLRARGVSPEELGIASLDEAKVTTREEAQKHPALFYHSMHFRQKCLADFFTLARLAVERHFPKGVRTLTNFSDFTHPANMMVRVDWFHLMRSNAVTLGWTENWLNQLSTKQLSSYLIDVLRCACKYNGQPVGAYTIGHGETPERLALKTVSYLAHGASALCYYNYGPRYRVWGDDWSQQFDLYPAVAEVNGMIARVEDFLLDGKLDPAECAILYPISSDIWQEGTTLGRERSFIYLMLLHRQVPAEIVTEEDIAGGALSGKKLLFLTGTNLLPETAAGLKKWVEAGGVLWSDAGAGLRDHLNRRSRVLDEVFGLEDSQVEFIKDCGRGRIELPGLEPVEKATWSESDLMPAGSAEVYCALERCKPAAASRILGRFKDGSPAGLMNRSGKGISIRFCFLPGITYVKSAFPESYKFGEHGRTFNPARFDGSLLPLVHGAVKAAGVRPPVRLSSDTIEATLIRSPHGLLVPLVNWTFEPLRELRVEVAVPGKGAVRVWSAAAGDLKSEREGNSVRVALPLKLVDFLVIEHKERKDVGR